MRIRSTKPEFWRSRRVASVSWDARLVLKGLESYVDDNGVGKDDIALIVGDVFSRDMFANPRETVARVSEAVSDLHQAGLIWRYEADGTELLFISFWESIQRVDKPNKPRFRRPDGTWAYGDSSIRESVANPRETVAPGTEEQGNRGTGDLLLSDTSDERGAVAAPDRFEEFWETYGKKVDRKGAEQKWRLALRKPGVTADMLIAAAAAYVTWERTHNENGRYIMGPAKWLLNERWNDERTSRRPPSPRSGQNGKADILDRQRERMEALQAQMDGRSA